MVLVPQIRLSPQVQIPQLGLGVYDMDDDTTERAILAAFELGYRSIDTAAVYNNETAVGRAIARSGLPREQIIVTTKIWGTDHAPDRVPAAIESSLQRLGLDYVDLYLIHWPETDRGLYPQTWHAMHALRESGKARAIGVCNFQVAHLENLMALGLDLPQINQIEFHPLNQQPDTVRFNHEHGIVTEAWSPLARGQIFENERLERIARDVGRTMSQVVLRWHVQKGVVAIPKSKSRERLAENLDVFDFALTGEQMAEIDSLDSRTYVDESLLRFQ